MTPMAAFDQVSGVHAASSQSVRVAAASVSEVLGDMDLVPVIAVKLGPDAGRRS